MEANTAPKSMYSEEHYRQTDRHINKHTDNTAADITITNRLR